MALPAEIDAPIGDGAKAGFLRAILQSPAWITLVGYLALAVLLFSRAWAQPTSNAAGAQGDPQLLIWTFRWVSFALSHHLNPFITNYVDYPQGMNLLWTGNTLLLGMVLSPLTAWSGVFSYNVAATLGPALSAWCAFLIIRRYVQRWPAAAAGALLYGFSPGMIAQADAGHLHVTFAIFPPLALLLIDEVIVRRRMRPIVGGILLGLLAGLQVLIGEETLVLTAIAGAIAVVIFVVVFRRPSRSELLIGARVGGAALLVFGMVAALPLAEQFLGAQSVHGRLQPSNFYVSDLLNFVIPSPLQLFSPPQLSWLSGHFTGDASSRDAYLGAVLLGWLVIQARHGWSDRMIRWSAALALVLGVLSLGPALHVAGVVTGIPLPWALFQGLPVLDNVLPGRFVLVAMLAIGLLVARAIDMELASASRIPSLAILAVALLMLVPRLEPASNVPIPSFFTSAAVQRIAPGGVMLVAPFSGSYSNDAMYWQAAAAFRFRMPEGYGFIPGTLLDSPPSSIHQAMVQVQFQGTAPTLTPELMQSLRQQLAAWRVAAVIVGPMPHRDVMIDLITRVIGRRPETGSGVDVWWMPPN